MSEPLQGILITSREIYDAVVRLTGRVDVLIEQQNHTGEEIKELKADVVRGFSDHEIRLRTLEKGRWPIQSLNALFALTSLGVAAFALFAK